MKQCGCQFCIKALNKSLKALHFFSIHFDFHPFFHLECSMALLYAFVEWQTISVIMHCTETLMHNVSCGNVSLFDGTHIFVLFRSLFRSVGRSLHFSPSIFIKNFKVKAEMRKECTGFLSMSF